MLGARHTRLMASALAGLLSCALPSPAGAAHGYTIVIDKLKFGPAPPQLLKGDVITWVNMDLFRHTATAADRSFDVDLPPGKSGKTRLMKSGRINFVCRYHPTMRGVLQVK